MQPGTRLGPYEILGPLGHGGMGEVYRARDTRLARDVAIKILPERMAADPAAASRFEQETRAVAALSHPNILAIHDVGRDAGVTYAVTELLDGETLRDKLTSRLSVRKAVDYAMQIAQGLAAAHAKGIVHRDVKPENVFVTTDGHVKILDFGLAKIDTPAGGDLTTMARIPTDAGTVLGTTGYLSPEQAQARPVDARSDIFSFGAVLYEMVAGARAFRGDSAIDTLHAIVHDAPAPVDAADANVPRELQFLLAKCLSKDPDERYQSTRDLVVDLKNVARLLDSSPRLTSVEPPKPSSAARRPRALLLAGVAAMLVVAAVAAGLYWSRSSGPASDTAAGMKVTIEPVTSLGTVIDAVLSPDGKYVAYTVSENARQGLFIRQLATASTLTLVPPSPVGFWGTTFTPDGSSLYYVTYSADQPDRALYSVPALGGTPRKLLTGLDSFPAFSPDARRIAYFRGSYPSEGTSSLLVADADGANVRVLATRRQPEFFVPIFFTAPAWSPDGQTILCPMVRRGTTAVGTIVAVRASDGKDVPFPKYEWPTVGQAIWAPDGSGVIAIGGDASTTSRPNQLWWLSPTTTVRRRMTSDLLDYRRVSVSADGRSLVAVGAEGTSSIWTVPLEGGGEPQRVSTGRYDGIAGLASAPGSHILYRSVQSGTGSIWMMDDTGANTRQLTTQGVTSYPSVLQGGAALVFAREGSGLWTIGMDGQNAKAIPNTDTATWPIPTPDGQWLFYILRTSGSAKLWKTRLDGTGLPQQVLNGEVDRMAISPDGKQLAIYYQEQPATPFVLAVIPIEGTHPTETFPVAPSSAYAVVRWTADGKALLHNSALNDRANIWLQPLGGGPPRQVTHFVDQNILGFDRSADGKTLIIARGILSRDALLIKLK
jgi:Tol biopolymer transport system component